MLRNKETFICLIFLFLSYLVSYSFFGKIVVPIYEFLNYTPPNYKVFKDFYFQGKEAFNIFLAGNIKWYYYPEILQPFTLLLLILNVEYFIYIFDIIERLLAFYFAYIMAKQIGWDKNIPPIIGLFYSTVVQIKLIPALSGSAIVFAPYLFYLLNKNKKLKIKHFFIFFLAGISSSPVLEFSVFLIFPLVFFLNNKSKNLSNYFLAIFSYLIGTIIVLLPMLYSINHEVLHRVDQIESVETIEFYNITTANLYSLFHLIKYFTYTSIILSGIFIKNKKIKILFFFLIFVFLVIIFKMDLRQVLSLFNKIFISFNFERIESIIPLIITLIFVYSWKENKKTIFFKFNFLLIFICSIILQLSFSLSVIGANLKNSLNNETKIYINEIIYSKKSHFEKINIVLKNLLNQENFSNNINLFKTERTFKDYYKFDEYKKFKQIIGDKRVASIGIDPMIAVMNNIKVIDGYHVLYPKKYKIRFREIIKDELLANDSINNFDSWGNQVYILYSDQNNLKVNFQKIKELGADYIIAAFKIKNENLLLKKISDHLYLYFIK